MSIFPADIYTEPSDVDPDTLANLGPLRRLAGIGKARTASTSTPRRTGRSAAPSRADRDAADRPAGQRPAAFYGLRYHVHINTAEEDITFHDQVGYWLWEPATGLVLQTLAIPRGQVAIASGQAAPDDDQAGADRQRGQTEYGICSTAFLEQAFRTDTYRIEVEFNPDGRGAISPTPR